MSFGKEYFNVGMGPMTTQRSTQQSTPMRTTQAQQSTPMQPSGTQMTTPEGTQTWRPSGSQSWTPSWTPPSGQQQGTQTGKPWWNQPQTKTTGYFPSGRKYPKYPQYPPYSGYPPYPGYPGYIPVPTPVPPPAPTYDCQSCSLYSGCGVWKNDPYYSCERCVADAAASWRITGNPLADPYYQSCAVNCHCRS